jgi:methionine aminotransferase
MSQLANEHNAINLSQGFPNFDVAPKLIELVSDAMKEGHNQYAPMQGLLELREEVSLAFERNYGTKYNADTEITITSGATQAIYSAITTIIHDGDEAIVIEPAFDIYIPGIRMNGGVAKTTKLKGDDFHIDWQELTRLITTNTKMIIINSPHNPTSTVLSEEDMHELERITRNTDIIILSDEVYEHIIFDGKKHHSVATYPKLASRSFIVGSFGKTFHVTGWKTGFCIAPKQLMDEFRKVHQNVVFAGNRPMQTAIAKYMHFPENYMDINKMYSKKRDYFLELMKSSRFTALPSYGTYFQLFNYDKISDENELDFATRLTKDHGVASIPLSYFYNDNTDNQMLRFCFAKTDETLEKAAKILCKI